MRKPLVSIASLFIFVLTVSGVAKADLITNGTFTGSPNATGVYANPYSDQTMYPGDWYDPTTITGWTFSDASGIIQNGGFGAQYFPATNPSGTSQFAFIQNNAGSPNAISQTVTDVSGKGYYLSFALTGSSLSPTIPVIISLDGSPIATILAAEGWQGHTIHVVGTGSDTISFSSNGGGVLAGLTDVSLVPTPEPSSMMLLGTGVLGLAAAGRRKFFNA